MLSYLAVGGSALLAAGLTMYSGFGLGTVLLPVFALFLPVEAAVLATALVHGANNAVIGLLVDLTRVAVYLALFATAGAGLAGSGAWPLIVTGALSAFTGVLIGRRYLHKVTMRSVQILVGGFLLSVGVALLLGLV